MDLNENLSMCVSMQAVATASGDKTVRLWGLADGGCLRTFEGHTASALRCCFLSSGTQVGSCAAKFDSFHFAPGAVGCQKRAAARLSSAA